MTIFSDRITRNQSILWLFLGTKRDRLPQLTIWLFCCQRRVVLSWVSLRPIQYLPVNASVDEHNFTYCIDNVTYYVTWTKTLVVISSDHQHSITVLQAHSKLIWPNTCTLPSVKDERGIFGCHYTIDVTLSGYRFKPDRFRCMSSS